MGERKVLNRYIPPDFDPSILPKFKRDRDRLMEVRMMLPFSMRCNTCGEYMYRGKKFNSKKEDVKGEDYLGIRKFRFYIKCTFCSAEISFKTDPKNSDYECESGASRNFELWRENRDAEEEVEKEKAETEESGDVMKSLEMRTQDSKQEMDILDALDQIKAINQRHARLDTGAVIDRLNKKRELESIEGKPIDTQLNPDGLTKEDEVLVKSIKFKSNSMSESVGKTDVFSGLSGNLVSQSSSLKEKNATVLIKKKRKLATHQNSEVQQNENNTTTEPKMDQEKANKDSSQSNEENNNNQEDSVEGGGGGLTGLLMGYGDEDSN